MRRDGVIGRTRAWWKLLRNPEIDPGTEYDLLGDRTFANDAGMPIVNMGYWRDVELDHRDSLVTANLQLFERVCAAADITPEDGLVLDAGCGFATSAIQCIEQQGPERILGLNLSDVQVEVGRKRIADAGLSDRIEIQKASATDIPLPKASVDKIVSIEAAFHFDPRDDFFDEARRVLRPGGLMSIADMVVPKPTGRLEKIFLNPAIGSLQVPASNLYGVDEYVRRLEKAGFEILESEVITADTVPRFRRWFFRYPFRNIGNYNVLFMAWTFGWMIYPPQYIHIVARRA